MHSVQFDHPGIPFANVSILTSLWRVVTLSLCGFFSRLLCSVIILLENLSCKHDQLIFDRRWYDFPRGFLVKVIICTPQEMCSYKFGSKQTSILRNFQLLDAIKIDFFWKITVFRRNCLEKISLQVFFMHYLLFNLQI